jgi:hypothetical protein
MTVYQQIHLSKLEVNPANDRHGDLGSEAAAIEWLLVNKTEKMKDILQKIVEKNGIFEEPLVQKKNGEDKYVVMDGNRRVACLKLLAGIAPSEIQNPLKSKIDTAKKNNDLHLDEYIMCRVEDNVNRINDILELRHTPGNSGAGQLKWDGHEKQNFLDRTGKSVKINLAREVNNILINSSKDARERVGIQVRDNQVVLTKDKDSVYSALSRIAKDMIAKKKTLDDVWDNAKKKVYLDELAKEGILPSTKKSSSDTVVTDKKDSSENAPARPQNSKPLRPYLLSADLPAPEQNQFFSQKFCVLFYELQNTLNFKNHEVSISIVFRAFLEILTNAYLAKIQKDVDSNLAEKIQAAFDHMQMQKTQKMPEETRAFIAKLSNANEFFSINTLHKTIHNDFSLSENDLRSYLNNLSSYIRMAVEEVNSKSSKAA